MKFEEMTPADLSKSQTDLEDARRYLFQLMRECESDSPEEFKLLLALQSLQHDYHRVSDEISRRFKAKAVRDGKGSSLGQSSNGTPHDLGQ